MIMGGRKFYPKRLGVSYTKALLEDWCTIEQEWSGNNSQEGGGVIRWSTVEGLMHDWAEWSGNNDALEMVDFSKDRMFL